MATEIHELHALIVEDDPEWSDRLARTIKQLMRENHYAADPDQNVLQARNIAEAEKHIQGHTPFNLVTMDMDLSSPKDSLGLQLLGMLRKHHGDAVSVVISGRGSEQSILRPSFSQHRVFDVVDKMHTPQSIRTTLLAALRYADILWLKEHQHLEQAEKSLDDLRKAYPEMGVLQDTLEEIRGMYRDHITGLQGREAVYKQLNVLRSGQNQWEICQVKIEHFTEFHEQYGSFESMEAIKLVAQILKQGVNDYARQSGLPIELIFIGYLGEQEFILMNTTEYGNHLEKVIERVDQLMDKRVRTLYHALDLEGSSPRFPTESLMRLRHQYRSLRAGEFSGVGIDDFLRDIWSPGSEMSSSSW